MREDLLRRRSEKLSDVFNYNSVVLLPLDAHETAAGSFFKADVIYTLYRFQYNYIYENICMMFILSVDRHKRKEKADR